MLRSLCFVLTSFAFVSPAASAIDYVRICSLFGVGFAYIPGTELCLQTVTGEIRKATDEGAMFGSLAGRPKWVGNKEKLCESGVRIDLTERSEDGFFARRPEGSVLKNAPHFWRTNDEAIVIPAGMYIDSAFLRGSLRGLPLATDLAIEVRVGNAPLPSTRIALAWRLEGAALYALVSPFQPYANVSGQDVAANAFLTTQMGGTVTAQPEGTVLADVVNPSVLAVTASASTGVLQAIAKTAGVQGNALSVELRGDSSTGASITNVDPNVIVIHYQPGVDDVTTLQVAIDAVVTPLPVNFYLSSDTEFLSDLFIDPAIIHLSGGKDATTIPPGNLQAGLCLRSFTEATAAMATSAATEGLASASSVTSLQERIAALEALMAVPGPQGPTGADGAPAAASAKGCSAASPADTWLSALALLLILRRARPKVAA